MNDILKFISQHGGTGCPVSSEEPTLVVAISGDLNDLDIVTAITTLTGTEDILDALEALQKHYPVLTRTAEPSEDEIDTLINDLMEASVKIPEAVGYEIHRVTDCRIFYIDVTGVRKIRF